MAASAISQPVRRRTGRGLLAADGICAETALRITRRPFTVIGVTFAVGFLAGVAIGRLEVKGRLIAALRGE